MPSSLDIFLSRILDLNGPHRRRRKNFQATTKHKNRLKRKEIKSDLIDVILIIVLKYNNMRPAHYRAPRKREF